MSKSNDKKPKSASTKVKPSVSAYKQAQSNPTATVMPFPKKGGGKGK